MNQTTKNRAILVTTMFMTLAVLALVPSSSASHCFPNDTTHTACAGGWYTLNGTSPNIVVNAHGWGTGTVGGQVLVAGVPVCNFEANGGCDGDLYIGLKKCDDFLPSVTVNTVTPLGTATYVIPSRTITC